MRALLKRMRDRRSSSRKYRRANGPSRRTKRKATLALSASVMAMNTGMIDTAPPGQPSVAMQAVDQAYDVDATQRRVPATKISVSDEFKEALVEEEGVREVVYRDVAGYPTVGVGHLITPKDNLRVGDRVSYDQIMKFLDQDLEIAEKAVERLVGDLPLFQHEFDALVDLVYNVGEGNVSKKKSPRLNAAIANADYEAIADQLHYRHAGGKKAKGLEYRSERRAQIFMDASYENPRAPA